MNNSFSIRRFGWLFKKTVLERPAQLLGLVALSLVISLLAYAFCKVIGGIQFGQSTSFILGLAGGGCFLAAAVYGYFSTNAGGSSYLTLPASHFEKWLCGIGIMAIYIVLFLLFFRAMDMVFIALYKHGLDPASPAYQASLNKATVFPFLGFPAKPVYILFFNSAGGMLVGSLYFNKASFIKVALILCGIIFGAFLLNLVIANLFFKEVLNAFPYFQVWVSVGKEAGPLFLPGNAQKLVSILFQYILPAILWGLAYLRIREKEF